MSDGREDLSAREREAILMSARYLLEAIFASMPPKSSAIRAPTGIHAFASPTPPRALPETAVGKHW